MDSPERGALMLVRFIAAALIGWTAVALGLDLAAHHLNPQTHPALKWTGIVADCVPAFLGVVMFVKSRSLAEWLSDKLDL